MCIHAGALVTLQQGDQRSPKAVAIVSILPSATFHLISYLSLPPPLSRATVSCLISLLLPLSQTLSKQLPCIFMHLCARAPFLEEQLVCIFGRRQLIGEAQSALVISAGPEALWPLNTLSHSSSSANTGLPLPVKHLCLH